MQKQSSKILQFMYILQKVYIFYTYELRTELHLFLHHTKFAFPIVPSALLSLYSFPKRILADQQIRIHLCPLKDLAPSETEQKEKEKKTLTVAVALHRNWIPKIITYSWKYNLESQ